MACGQWLNALDERIERDDWQHPEPEQNGDAVERQQHREPNEAEHHHEGERRLGRDLPARQRPRHRARDLGVDVAIDDVVIGAAGAAHDHSADQKEQQERGIGVGIADASRRERHRPEAGKCEQKDSNRTIGAGEPEIGEDRFGR